MSSISVAGDTSGTITLQAPAVAGSAVLTLPTVSGTVVATDSAGNVGIGRSPTTFKLEIQNGLGCYTTSVGTIFRAHPNDAQSELGTLTNHPQTFITSSTERMRIDGSGNVTLQNNISVGGAAPTTSGTGITFPTTQSASSDANTLDDYEEGTWTPNVYNASSSSTFAQKLGSYRKIGAVVHCWFVCDGGNSGSAGSALQLTGFPFTINSPGGVISVGIWGANGLSPTTGNIANIGSTLQIYYGGGSISSSTSYISGYFSYPTI